MKTTILALAAVATLGMAVPAFAQEGAPRSSQPQSQAQDFSSSHRHWHWGRHHHRHHGWCRTHWRHGHRVTICR